MTGRGTDPMTLDAEASRRLAAFASAVRGSPHNLLSPRALDAMEQRHIPECLGLASLLPPDEDVLDVGTGGGFPGMVVAIARPDLRVTLLDSTSKKIRFLDEVAATLGIGVQTLVGRSEDLVRERAGSVGVVTARAVAPLDRLLPWTLPWLRPGGAVYAVKGDRFREEIAAAMPTIARVRANVEVIEPGRVVETEPADAPDGVVPRIVVIRTRR